MAMQKRKFESKLRGIERWIRLRGSSDDPESFDLAVWNGIAWGVGVKTDDGRLLTLYIPDYMVAEILPSSANPQLLYTLLRAA
jgi:hypothetical protein